MIYSKAALRIMKIAGNFQQNRHNSGTYSFLSSPVLDMVTYFINVHFTYHYNGRSPFCSRKSLNENCVFKLLRTIPLT